MKKIANQISELVGHTPLVRLNRVTQGVMERWWSNWSPLIPAAALRTVLESP